MCVQSAKAFSLSLIVLYDSLALYRLTLSLYLRLYLSLSLTLFLRRLLLFYPLFLLDFIYLSLSLSILSSHFCPFVRLFGGKS